MNLWVLGGLLSTQRYFPLPFKALYQLRLIKMFHGAKDIHTALGFVAIHRQVMKVSHAGGNFTMNQNQSFIDNFNTDGAGKSGRTTRHLTKTSLECSANVV